MALQSSGPISIGDVATEFSDAAPNSLSEFYGAADGVPASGPISLSDFYGKSSIITEVRTITEGNGLPAYAEIWGYNRNGDTNIGNIDSNQYNGHTIILCFKIEASLLSPPEDRTMQVAFVGTPPNNDSFFKTVQWQGGPVFNRSALRMVDSNGWRYWIADGTFLSQWNGSGTSTITFTR